MIVLDTNIVSEAMRTQPDTSVASWLASRPSSSLFITTVTQAELLYGVALLPDGKRRRGLEEAVRMIVRDEFRGRVLPFDGPAAEQYATIAAGRRSRGKPISVFDAQIAAIARAKGAHVATRNLEDFDDCGINLLNPWMSIS
ncbi:type II toxin-antitoxin system VapC family toxin [soil metagenome]|jgi:predicted nucleic acid-binding protein